MRVAEPLVLPEPISAVFALLDARELPAWLVGGCLRDILLGREPKDWDFATPCPPETVREKLSGAGLSLWDTGLKHGTLTFWYRGTAYEITTFRVDGPYEDFRRPKWVAFTSSLQEDLARRDFTINAMAYHWQEGLTDPYGGIKDIAERLIRAVGLPQDRLQEDALRILRGIRFAGSLGFTLEEELALAMREKAELLLRISPERLASELKAMLLLSSPGQALELLADMGLWPYIAPEMSATVGFDQKSRYHHLDAYRHMIQAVENAPPDLEIRLAALFHDIAKPAVWTTTDGQGKRSYRRHETTGAEMAGRILDRLRFSHGVRDRVMMLIRHHMLHLKKLSDADLRRMLSDLPKPREDNLERILLLQKADLLASRYTEESLNAYERFSLRCRDVLTSGCPLDLADLAVKGEELEGLGIAPANRSKALKAMLAEVLLDPEQNRRPVLLDIAERYR